MPNRTRCVRVCASKCCVCDAVPGCLKITWVGASDRWSRHTRVNARAFAADVVTRPLQWPSEDAPSSDLAVRICELREVQHLAFVAINVTRTCLVFVLAL